MTEHFDAIVVGSGFGGSVSAYRLREAGQNVCLLERGKAWPAGSFPRNPHELRDNFWDPSKGLYGLFDIWTFKGIESLISSCLGGGSIIYANVFIRKDEDWFVRDDGEYWPVTRADLDPHYDAVEKIIDLNRYPFDKAPYSTTPKTLAMQHAGKAGGLDWGLPKLAVTFGADAEKPMIGEQLPGSADNLHGVTRFACRLCGECNVGCNFGSKNTLDYNYLSHFKAKGGEIRTLAEVKTFAPLPGGGYTVTYAQHDPGGQSTEVTVTANRLVLSAGSLGTTFLLLKNRDNFPGISDALGTKWCGNGDLLGFLVNAKRDLDPERGPVITSRIRYPGEKMHGYYIEDGGYPNFTNYVMEALDSLGTTRRALRFAWRYLHNVLTAKPVSNLSGEVSALVGDQTKSSKSLPLLGMGRDTPDGRMTIKDGYLQNDWTPKTSKAYYTEVQKSMHALAASIDAKFIPQPLWYLRRNVTVHAVGGCPMGRDIKEGVVDSHGQVFGYPGLSIADGSVMPGPVGPNPSWTIAAMADRSVDRILELAKK